jgi:DNA-directed RNA polymerase alpha subunit
MIDLGRLFDDVFCEHFYNQKTLSNSVQRYFKCLKSREKKILKLRYSYDKKSYAHIAKLLNLSPTRIHHIELAAKRKLREPRSLVRFVGLEDYLSDSLNGYKISVKCLLPKPIDYMELSSRSENCLRVAKIKTIKMLITKTESDLLSVKNFGKKSLNEIKDRLSDLGLSLAK